MSNKKIYDALHKFVDSLSHAENGWKQNATALTEYLDAIKPAAAEAGLGKTEDELVKSLLVCVSVLVTKPEETEDYPAINFIENGQ